MGIAAEEVMRQQRLDALYDRAAKAAWVMRRASRWDDAEALEDRWFKWAAEMGWMPF
jgi:hypothetical protein